MKKNTSLLSLLIALALLISCAENRLELALKLAEENRSELEKVLQHYANDPLKLKATKFLIENMPGHYSITDEETDGFFQKVSMLYPDVSQPIKQALFRYPEFFVNIPLESARQDIHEITAEFLISHIDYKFALMERLYHSKITPFEMFLEYILPYRVSNEPLHYIMYDYTPLSLDYVEKHRDLNLSQTQWRIVVRDVYAETTAARWYTLPPPVNQTVTMNECISESMFHHMVSKMSGIASGLDYVRWHYRNGFHYWGNVIDLHRGIVKTGIYAKVYRKTYAHNKIPKNRETEHIPEQFRNPFLRDVTDQHAVTDDITLKLPRLKGRPKYMYLAVFNDLDWQPVAWTKIKGRKARFEKVGRDVVYQLVYFDGHSRHVAGYPFFLDFNGKIIEIKPDKTEMALTLTRKFPFDERKVMWAKSLRGTIIKASNDRDFITSDTIGIVEDISEIPYFTFITTNNEKYQYLKLVNPPNRNIELAELFIFDGNGERLLTDDLKDYFDLSSDVSRTSSTASSGGLSTLFDKDNLTVSRINRHLYVDFGKPIEISKIELLARNDDNNIFPTNVYELFYATPTGWKSVGTKEADERRITFENVPSGALYWLRCLTKGVEERIFTYDGERVVFH